MANPSKRKGTSAEQLVAGAYRDHGWPFAERRALSGSNDRGDIAGVPSVVTEVKACRTMALNAWLKEAEVERLNDNAEIAVVWHKLVGLGDPLDWPVSMRGHQWLRLLKQLGY